MKRIRKAFWHWLFEIERATSTPTPISWTTNRNGILQPNSFVLDAYKPMSTFYMKSIFLPKRPLK